VKQTFKSEKKIEHILNSNKFVNTIFYFKQSSNLKKFKSRQKFKLEQNLQLNKNSKPKKQNFK
jgi:hypothetical protein